MKIATVQMLTARLRRWRLAAAIVALLALTAAIVLAVSTQRSAADGRSTASCAADRGTPFDCHLYSTSLAYDGVWFDTRRPLTTLVFAGAGPSRGLLLVPITISGDHGTTAPIAPSGPTLAECGADSICADRARNECSSRARSPSPRRQTGCC